MKTSETLGQFAEAMAKVQAELKPAQMNAKNPFLKNKYADLADVVAACQKLSASHGLATVQMPFSYDNGVGITTRIIHTSGEWVEGEVTFPLYEEKGISMAQAAGKLITYARRYALASAFGVVADEDADGTAPQPAQQSPQKKQAQPPPEQKQGAGLDTQTPLTIYPATLKHLNTVGRGLYGDGWDAKRPELVKAKTKGRTASSKELEEEDATALIVGIAKKLEEQSAQEYPEATPAELFDTPATGKGNNYTE